MFTVSFDEASMKEIALFAGFAVLLDKKVQYAMREAGGLIVQTAKDNTWSVFDHPSGQLADSIHLVDVSPYEIQISVDAPYGARREFGFIGHTDSLGRVGGDRARPYLIPAMEVNRDKILNMIDDSVNQTIAEISV